MNKYPIPEFMKFKLTNILIFTISIILLSVIFLGCQKSKTERNWHANYDFIYNIQPIIFHYNHGILTGSYQKNQETIEVHFNDVCNYLGHVCLCGAGGYKISEMAVNTLKKEGENLEKGDFIIISSRDHTVSDVISYVLGCERRNNPEKNLYFIDTSIVAPKREYHYLIGYPPAQKAVQITYYKHLLTGNELMDRLWKIELAYEENPDAVNQDDLELYQNTMVKMVQDILLDKNKNLFRIDSINYNDFQLKLDSIKAK